MKLGNIAFSDCTHAIKIKPNSKKKKTKILKCL